MPQTSQSIHGFEIFDPLTVARTVIMKDMILLASFSNEKWRQAQGSSPDSLTKHSDEILKHQEVFPHPIQAPKSKGSASSHSGSSNARDPSVSPRPARQSLTSISNLGEPAHRILPDPDPNGQPWLPAPQRQLT